MTASPTTTSEVDLSRDLDQDQLDDLDNRLDADRSGPGVTSLGIVVTDTLEDACCNPDTLRLRLV